MSKKRNRKLRAARVANAASGAENYASDKVAPQEGTDAAMVIRNGLTDAIFGGGVNGVGSMLSQADTMFKNNRWYLVSNLRQLLSESYVEFGTIQTIVDVPVDDALRGGVVIKTKQLEDDEITKLENKMDREGDLITIGQATKWNRLFGGAGILIITDQDPKSELNMDILNEKSKVEFRDVDMWELYYSQQNTDDYAAAISDEMENEFYNYYGKEIHKSRVLKLTGLKAPSFVRPRLRGWGVSVVEAIIRSVNQYLKATDLSFEVLDEFKVDVFKIHGLAQTLLSKGGTQKVQERVQLANSQKNYQHAITMDGNDDYVQKQLSFAGLSEAMDGIRKQLASDLRMPLSKLFGISSAGFSSGEDDIENYNSMIESSIRSKIKFEIIKVIEVRCQQLFGMIPDDLDLEFVALRVLSSEQEENVKTSVFGRLLQARQAGEISGTEFKEACNRDDLLPIKVEADDTVYPSAMTGKDMPDVNAPPQPAKSASSTPDIPPAKNSADPVHQVGVVGLICGANPEGKGIDYILTGKRKDNGLWTFPAGHLEAGETPIEGACRETFEEAGIAAIKELAKPATYKVVRDEKHDRDIRVHAFTANLETRIAPRTFEDPDQEIEIWRWVPLDKSTHELKQENRHAKKDILIDHLLGGKKK